LHRSPFDAPDALPSDYDEWDLNPAELPLLIGKELENDLDAGLGKKHAMSDSAVLAIKMLRFGCSFNGNQSGDTDLLLLNEPEEGGYGGNFLDPHLDALRGIVTATDDQKGSDSRLLEQSHGAGGQLRHSVRSRSK
jgi:hypothetical protein